SVSLFAPTNSLSCPGSCTSKVIVGRDKGQSYCNDAARTYRLNIARRIYGNASGCISNTICVISSRTVGSTIFNYACLHCCGLCQGSTAISSFGVVAISRQGNCGQNTDDRNHDHQLDQCKTFLHL